VRRRRGKRDGLKANNKQNQPTKQARQHQAAAPPHLIPMTKRPRSPNTLIFNNMAEPTEGREPKRRRSAPSPLDLNVALAMKPEKNVDVIDDGDVLLVVSGLKGEDKP
jgi:hypothetical protein